MKAETEFNLIFNSKWKGVRNRPREYYGRQKFSKSFPTWPSKIKILAVTNETHVFLSEKIHPILAR